MTACKIKRTFIIYKIDNVCKSKIGWIDCWFIVYPLIDIFLSTWCRQRTWTHRQRTRPGLRNHHLLHLDLDSCRFHHLWPDLHVPLKSHKPRDPEDLPRDPRDLLQVLRRLGEGGQESRLRRLLWPGWREEAGCDGGSFFISIFTHH